MNFSDILQQFDIPIAPTGHHHARSGWLQFDCPFCAKDSQKYHMGYSLTGNFVNCWRCGHHSLTETLIELTNQNYNACKKLLASLEHEVIEEEIKPKGKLSIPKDVAELHPAHIRYLKERGFDCEALKRLWELKGIAISARLAWRIFIPVYHNGVMVTWTTRTISKQSNVTRYISASPSEEALPLHSLLYGEDYCRSSIIITEGPANVWRLGPGSVCTFSTNYTQAQLRKMLKYPVRAVCFDAEKEAQKRAKELCTYLESFPGETMNILLEHGNDPADTSKKEIEQIRKVVLK